MIQIGCISIFPLEVEITKYRFAALQPLHPGRVLERTTPHEVPFLHTSGKNSKQPTCWGRWHLGCIATTLGVPPNCPMGLVAIQEAYSEHQ